MAMGETKHTPFRILASFLVLLATSMAAATSEMPGTITLFEGARLITGDGSAPIMNAAFIVDNGVITAVGRQDTLAIPTGAVHINLSGKTVIPALVDDHVHMGYRKGSSFSARNYTQENLLDILDRFAFFGVSAILETGTGRGDLPFKTRPEARTGTRYLTTGSGFAMPNAGPGGAMRDSIYGITTEAQAREYVRELATKKPDMVKIWVDDRDGKVEKLKPDLYRAIIDEAHRHHLKVMAHIVNLADAKDLLRAGVDGFAHMVRDKDVDDELLELLRARPNVFFLETLWGERRSLYTSRPAWLDDPMLRDIYTADDLKELSKQFSPDPDAKPQVLARARAMAEMSLHNTARLEMAGVKLGLGTDTGGMNGGQFFGLGTHIEMELLVTKAGLTPMQALVIGTRNSAAILGLDQLGTMAAGKSADFIVLDANPLDDISNTRRISSVYLRGKEIPRNALKAKWAAED
ncbi:MAG: amidohydrolase family protein [Ferrovum sp.]|nr:amidohydrolase family protein [Ferrovum sp.]